MSRLPLLTATLLLALALPAHAAGEKAVPTPHTTNSIGITMLTMPAGKFVMGSCLQDSGATSAGEKPCRHPDPDASENESPQHVVSIRAFQMSRTEVTVGQFKRFIRATGNTQLADRDFLKYNAQGDDMPVVQVSWHDAQAFIAWLNQQEGGGYRLPSEAEWEYACRAGSPSSYCGSDNLDAVGWYQENSGDHRHRVAQKKANAWGLHDMSGNVWEWMQDSWHANYTGAPDDGRAWEDGTASRVLRGGSWHNLPLDTRALLRDDASPEARTIFTGFRLARTLP